VAAVVEGRNTYQTRGLPLPSGSGGSGERSAVERHRDILEKSGAVTFYRQQGRRTHWKLTDSADWRLRRLATWTGWEEMMILMLAVREYSDVGYMNGHIVPDWALAHGVGHGDEWSVAEKSRILTLDEFAAPALCRGLLVSWSDLHGATGYGITDAGRAYLSSDPMAPDVDGIDYDSAMNDAYLDVLKDARRVLAAARPSRDNVSEIPLGAGSWPEDPAVAPVPPIFTKKGEPRSLRSMIQAILKNNAKQQEKAAKATA
jgi:DNA-binding transcriptional ArsR family regulator